MHQAASAMPSHVHLVRRWPNASAARRSPSVGRFPLVQLALRAARADSSGRGPAYPPRLSADGGGAGPG